MRKTQIDYDEGLVRDNAPVVLNDAASNPTYAQQLHTSPSTLANALGAAIGAISPILDAEGDQLCLSIPELGIHECVPNPLGVLLGSG